MPKFLDAPSWYDNEGSQRTIVTTMRIGMSNTGRGGYCNVPVISEGSASLDDIPEQPLYTLPFVSGTQSVGVIPYWSGTRNGYLVTPKGTSGQVLTWSGGGPRWRTLSLYLHRIRLTTASFDAMATVYCWSSDSLTNNNLSGLVNFLTEKECNSIDSCLMANGVANGAGVAVAVAGIYAKATGQLRLVTYELSKDFIELRDFLMATSGTVTETIIAM